jgi:hypothetical protein
MKVLICLVLMWLPLSLFAEGTSLIEDFETGQNWTLKNVEALNLSVSEEIGEVKEGKASGKLEVQYSSPVSGAVHFPVPEKVGEVHEISLWVRGDGGRCHLQFSLRTEDGGIFSVEKAIEGDEWTNFQIPLSAFQFNAFSGAPEDAGRSLDTKTIIEFQISSYQGLESDADRHTVFIDQIEFLP